MDLITNYHFWTEVTNEKTLCWSIRTRGLKSLSCSDVPATPPVSLFKEELAHALAL
jgi:hypothetical protein